MTRETPDLRAALRAVLRDFDREPTDEYLVEAARIFLDAALTTPEPAPARDNPFDPERGTSSFLAWDAGFSAGQRATPEPAPLSPDDERWWQAYERKIERWEWPNIEAAIRATPEPAPAVLDGLIRERDALAEDEQACFEELEALRAAPAVLDVERLRSPRNSLGKLALPKGLMELAVEEAYEKAQSWVGDPEDGIVMTSLSVLADEICNSLAALTATSSEATGGPIPIADITGIDAIERSLLAELRTKVEAALTITAPSDLSTESFLKREAYEECRAAVLALLSPDTGAPE